MSNVIKAYTVRYEEEAKKTIDTNHWMKQQIPVKQKEMPAQIQTDSGEFTQGIKALVVEPIPSEEETKIQSSQIIEEAKSEAKAIIEEANREAEQKRNEIYQKAKEMGYTEGIQMGNQEVLTAKEEYEDRIRQLEDEYDSLLDSLEPKIATVIATLIEKITGILVEDKEDVIRYLVVKALKSMDKSSEYTIKVSEEDYAYLSSRKKDIISSVGREILLYVTEDSGLKKNQCLIETDLRVIDCSLDVQLGNLITDIKLLSGM